MVRINVGDTVNVYFNTADAEHEVKVLGVPSDVIKYFIVERDNGMIVNIQDFCKMVKVR